MMARPALEDTMVTLLSDVSRRVKRLEALETTTYPIFNVQSFGAIPDDLTVDNRPLIQEAVDLAIAAGGGTIYFPPGVYTLLTAFDAANRFIINVQNAQHITFQGYGATLYVPPDSVAGRPIALRGSADIVVEGLTINHSYGHGQGQCLGIFNSSQVVVRNSHFLNSDNYGIVVGEDTEPLITDVDISFSGHVLTRLSGGLTASFAVGETVVVTGAVNVKNVSAFVITGLTDTTITVAETFTAEVAGATVSLKKALPCDDVFVLSCTFDNIATVGLIDFPKALSARHVFMHNTFTNCGKRTSDGGTGLAIKPGQATVGCIVGFNAIDGCLNGIGIGNWETILVAGNTIANSDAFGIVNTMSYHPTYHNASFQDCLISGNTLVHRPGFVAPSTNAAWCLNGAVSASWGTPTGGPIRFVDNEVTNWTIPYAINTLYSVSNVELDNNRFINCLYSAVGGAPVYQSPGITFVAATKTILDTDAGLLRYIPDQVFTVTLSISNNGSLTVVSVAADGSSMTVAETLVNESVGAPGPKFSLTANPMGLVASNNTYRNDLLSDTGTLVNTSTTMSGIGNVAAWHTRDFLIGANIPALTYVVSINVAAGSLVMSAAATGSAVGQVVKHGRSNHVLHGSDGGAFIKNTLIGQHILEIQGSTLLVSQNRFQEMDPWGQTQIGAMVIRAAGTYVISHNDVDNGTNGQLAYIVNDGGIAGVTILEFDNTATPTTILPLRSPITATLSTSIYHTDSGHRIFYAAAIPVTGTYVAGDLLWYTAPAAGSGVGAVCTVGGTPGTWVEFGRVADIGVGIHKSVNISVNNAAWTALTWDVEDWDSAADYWTGSSALIVRTPGTYIISGAASFANNVTGNRGLRIRINAATTVAQDMRLAAGGTDTTDIPITEQFNLALNDAVRLEAWQTSGAALNVVATSVWSPSLRMIRVG